MRILYGITKSNFGGAQRYVYELAVAARERGHEVKVVCGQTGTMTDKLEEVGIEVISLPGMQRDINLLTEIASGIEVMKIIWRERPGAFHINSSKMGGVGCFAVRLVNIYSKLQAKNYKLKAVFTSHGWAFNESWRPGWQKMLIKFFVWLTVLLSHKTICVSDKTKNDVSNLPLVRSKLTVIHNGIRKFDLLARERARRELGVHEKENLVVGTASELHKVKGLDVLLEAWDKFARSRHTELIIMGEGEGGDDLMQYADELGITESVTFKGFVDNARTYFTGLDIFIMSSRSENLPYAVLEAGIAGLPVIATRVGGIPEVVESGVNGVLVEPENPEEIFSSLLLLSDNPRMRDRLGKELEKTVLENFSFDKMVNETLETYS